MAEVITTLTAVFVAAAIMLFVAKKLGQPAVPAYIVAGIGTGLFVEQSQLIQFAELGIAFLIFIFGMRFDPGRIKSVARESQITTTLQLFFIGTSAFGVATLFGLSQLNALYFSLAAALSSSLIGLELMEKEVKKNVIHGRLSESINLLQDSIGVIAIIALGASSFAYADIVSALGSGAAVIALGLGIRLFLFDHLAKLAEGSRELLMLSSLSLLTGFIYISEILGLSMFVGAFSAGIAVARFPHNMEIIDTMGSIKDFFAAIFFVVLGALLSVPSLGVLSLAFLLILLTTIVKPLIVVTSLILQGYDSRTAYLTGFGLDQISEYALIIAIEAFLAGTIATGVFEAIVIAAVVTMTISSYTTQHQHRTFELIANNKVLSTTRREMNPEQELDSALADHVILIGYDIQGKRLAEELDDNDKQFVVIDNDPEKIADARKNQENFIYGNIMSEETWNQAKPEQADLIISTVPFRSISEKIISIDTEADKILRAEQIEEAHSLLEKGATYVAVPDILSAELLEGNLRRTLNDVNYREELRRRNLLEVKKYLQGSEG